MTTEEVKDTLHLSPQGLVPVVEKDDLIQKLQSVPEEVLRSILTNQVDLEIRLKHKELKLTEEEIGKCEAQMLALRKFLEVPNELSFRNEPNDFTLKYYDILNKSLSVNYTKLQQLQYAQEHPVFKENMFTENTPATHSYRTRSTTSSLRPSVGGLAVRVSGCLYRRTDGVIVKLTCPDCHRSNFSSAQGFLNHSRIAHSKEYASQDAAALRCGEVLPDEFQDEEGLASLTSMRQRGADPSKTLNTSEGYFDLSGTKSDVLSNFNSHTEHRSKPVARRSTPDLGRESRAHSEEAKAIVRDSIGDGIGTDELMKKLISSGVARDASEFKSMLGEIQKEVPNSHLFADEEEVEEVKDEAKEELKEEAKELKEEIKQPSGIENVQQKSNEGQPPRSTNLSRNSDEVNLQASTSTPKNEEKASTVPERLEVGGKYENRLRRRKSRAEMSLANEESGVREDEKPKASDDRRFKRKRAQR